MGLQPVRGTRDIYGVEALRFRYLQNTALEVAARYGFQEIETPLFEFTDVFGRTLGDTSDIVSKEMYTFEDRGGEKITLRPEGTAGAVRCLISEGLQQELPLKWIYLGSMFRYERPQKGRYRQFHQVGIEMLGFDSPLADVEAISLAHTFLSTLGLLDKTVLHLNSIGDGDTRKKYRQSLVDYLTPHAKELSAESQQRLTTNPLRILDSKDPKDLKLCAGAPQLAQSLSAEAHKFFDTVQKSLGDLGIAYQLNPGLVRGLDYYCHSVFEFRTSLLGAQDAVVAGGRYDPLVEMMGGPKTASVGWAAGLERLALLLDHEGPPGARPVALIPLGDAAQNHAAKLAHDLRRQGLAVEFGYSGNLAKRLKRANRAQARWALIFGDSEMEQRQYQLKDLDSGEQKLEPLTGVLQKITVSN